LFNKLRLKYHKAGGDFRMNFVNAEIELGQRRIGRQKNMPHVLVVPSTNDPTTVALTSP
jgi:hypothetical protein